MGKFYLGICEDTKKKGKWVQTLCTQDGIYNTTSGSIWRGLKARLKKLNTSYKVYTNGFKDFQEFCDWNQTQIGYDLGWHLDKDLLTDSFEYGPTTCCLLPPDLNVLMQGIGSWKRGELVGASFFKRDGNWRAYGNDFYKQIHLGYHDTQENAHAAWLCDKAKRIDAYDKNNLSEKIVDSLINLVDNLNDRAVDYTSNGSKRTNTCLNHTKVGCNDYRHRSS